MTDDDKQRPGTLEEGGAEGDGSRDKLPAAPAGDDESPLGDSDQHSSADA